MKKTNNSFFCVDKSLTMVVAANITTVRHCHVATRQHSETLVTTALFIGDVDLTLILLM